MNRSSLVWFLWLIAIALPILVQLVRILCGYSGWMSVFVLVGDTPTLLVAGLVLAGVVHLATRGVKRHPGLRGVWIGSLVWFAGNILGPGVLLSDSDDREDQPGPFGGVIPIGWEVELVYACVAVAFSGLLVALVAAISVRVRAHRDRAGRDAGGREDPTLAA